MPNPNANTLALLCALNYLLATNVSFAAGQLLRQRPISEPTVTAPMQGGTAVETGSNEQTVFERIWGLATLYKNKDADWLNELRFVGRFQLEEYNIDSELAHDSDWIVRRSRIGLKA